MEDPDAAYAVRLAERRQAEPEHHYWRTGNCSRARWEREPLSSWKSGMSASGRTAVTSRRADRTAGRLEFRPQEYTPFEVYMKALFEYFRMTSEQEHRADALRR